MLLASPAALRFLPYPTVPYPTLPYPYSASYGHQCGALLPSSLYMCCLCLYRSYCNPVFAAAIYSMLHIYFFDWYAYLMVEGIISSFLCLINPPSSSSHFPLSYAYMRLLSWLFTLFPLLLMHDCCFLFAVSVDRGEGRHDGGRCVGGGKAGRRRHLDLQPRCSPARHHPGHDRGPSRGTYVCTLQSVCM